MSGKDDKKSNVSDTPTNDAAGNAEPKKEDGAIPPALAQFMEKVDGRMADFGRDIGKLRERIKSGSGDSPTKPEDGGKGEPATGPAPLTREDLAAAMQLGEVMAKLPDDAKKQVQELQNDGWSYQQALAAARLALSTKPADATSNGNTPPHHGATPGKSKPGVSAPQSQADWQKLTGEQKRELLNDPDFDLAKIRR